jgi:hypothetical protein
MERYTLDPMKRANQLLADLECQSQMIADQMGSLEKSSALVMDGALALAEALAAIIKEVGADKISKRNMAKAHKAFQRFEGITK